METFAGASVEAIAVDEHTCAVAMRHGGGLRIALFDLYQPNRPYFLLNCKPQRSMAAVSLCFSPASREYLVVATGEDLIFWDTNKLQKDGPPSLLKRFKKPISSISCAPFGAQHVAIACEDKYLTLYDFRAEGVAGTLTMASGTFGQVQWSRASEHILATSNESEIRIWDTRMPQPVAKFNSGHSAKICSIAWSTTGAQEIAVGLQDMTILFFNVTGEQCRPSIRGGPLVRYSPCGKAVVTSGLPKSDEAIRVWTMPPAFPAALDAPPPTSRPVLNKTYYDFFSEPSWSRVRLVAFEESRIALIDMDVLPEHTDSPFEKRLSDPAWAPADDASAPATFAQELQYLQSAIESVRVSLLDESARRIEADIRFGDVTYCKLEIGLPALYPNGSHPNFHLTSTFLPAELTIELEQEIADLAIEYVGLGKPCVVPCLQRLVAYLRHRYSTASNSMDDPSRLLHPCGAHFSPSGILVTFGLPDNGKTLAKRLQQAERPAGASTSGSSSALGIAVSDKAMADFFLGQTTKAVVAVRGVTKSVVLLDATGVQMLDRKLASSYVFTGDSLPALCETNARNAKAARRPDVARMWQLLNKSLDPRMHAPSVIPWASHPFGGRLVESLFVHFQRMKDIQTVATLVHFCGEYARTCGESFSPMTPDMALLGSQCLQAYADILHAWELFNYSAELYKDLAAKTAEPHASLRCPNCELEGSRGLCACARQGPSCSVCRGHVRGLGIVCPVCHHGGHAHHLAAWFRTERLCPAGCGCPCIDGSLGAPV
eukprot:m.90468 g.90468  ORF g.90468 m.90468 type:complete len:772 (+) comp8465_c0_seq2:58-2373(+)